MEVREHGGLPRWLSGKEFAFQVGDTGSIPQSGRSPGEGNGYHLQYSCLRNTTDRGTWRATVHGVAKSWAQLSDFTSHFTNNILISSDWTTRIHTDLPAFTLVSSQSHHHPWTETEWPVIALNPPSNNPVFTMSSKHWSKLLLSFTFFPSQAAPTQNCSSFNSPNISLPNSLCTYFVCLNFFKIYIYLFLMQPSV